MSDTAINDKKARDELKTRRNQLFALFVKYPAHITLAIEIKQMDDLLAIASDGGSVRKSAHRTKVTGKLFSN